MYIIHLKYIKSNKKSEILHQAHYLFKFNYIFISNVRSLLVVFFRDFPIFYVLLLPIQPLIIPAFVYCLHQFCFWCKIY